MLFKDFLEMVNKFAEDSPESLEMEVWQANLEYSISGIEISERWTEENIVVTIL